MGVRAAAFAEAGDVEQAVSLAARAEEALAALSGDSWSGCEPVSPRFTEALAVIREGNPFRE